MRPARFLKTVSLLSLFAASVAAHADPGAVDVLSQLSTEALGDKPRGQVSLSVPFDVNDCSAVPGAIVHDDGSVENGYSGNPATITTFQAVDRFTPAVYPATFSRVCIAFVRTTGPATLNFDIVFYDDDGPGGAPGTLLGSQAATITGIPTTVTAIFGSYDVSALAITVPSGNVYIGARFTPPGGVFVSSDESSATPSANGFLRFNTDAWGPTSSSFPSYRSMFIRAIEAPSAPTLIVEDGNATVADACTSNPDQSGNGVVEPGELVTLGVPVRAAAGGFSNVLVSLGVPAPAGVTYVTSSASLGNLADGQTATAALQVRVDQKFTCLSDVVVPVTVVADEGSAGGAVSLDVGAAGTYPPGDVPKPIPDNSAAGTTSIISVTQPLTLTDLRVRVNITHTWIGDLVIRLTSPGGTTVTLLDRPGVPASSTVGCNNNNVNVTFADGQADPEAICTGNTGDAWPVTNAGPVQPLAGFAGQSTVGNWTLFVSDNAGADTGTIVDWELLPAPAFSGICEVCTDGGGDPDPDPEPVVLVPVPALDAFGLGLLALLVVLAGAWVGRRARG